MKRARYQPAARDELRAAVATTRPNALAAASTSKQRSIEPHGIRRAKVRRHPYLVVYTIEDHLVVLAIAHTSKKPGYWRVRIEK